MLLNKKSTYLGLDLSINGTGVSLVSNDPSLIKEYDVAKLSKSKFFLAEAAFIHGTRKGNETSYVHKQWSHRGLIKGEKISVPLALRAHHVYQNHLSKYFKHDLDAIVIEGNAFGATGRIFDIAEFIGQLKYQIELHYLNLNKSAPIILIPPTNLKLYTTGKGRDDEYKTLMLTAVQKRYGLDLIDHNICDSFALAMMGAELGVNLAEFAKRGSFKELKAYRKKMGLAS